MPRSGKQRIVPWKLALLKNGLNLPNLDVQSTGANFVWAMTLQSIGKAAGSVRWRPSRARFIAQGELGLMLSAATISRLSATLLHFGIDPCLVCVVPAGRPSGSIPYPHDRIRYPYRRRVCA